MKVIDEILNEWSYRCHDGIVDLNNLDKVSILKEILKSILKEDIDDEILDLLDKVSYREKKKVLDLLKEPTKYQSTIKNLKQKSKGEEEKKVIELETILRKKEIPDDICEYIALKTIRLNQVSSLKALVNSQTLDTLGNKGTLKIDNLNWINSITTTQSSLSLGKGEILLTIMLENAILAKSSEYDININGKQVEVKQSGKNEKGKPTGAIISKLGRSSNYENIWTEDFKNKYFGTEFKGKLSSWNPIYKKYKSLSSSLKSEFLDDINTLAFKNFPKLEDNDFKGKPEDLYRKIAYCFVGDYLKDKVLIILNSNLDYIILDKESYLENILTNQELHANASFIPRISYKEIIPTEEDSEDLSDEQSNPPKEKKEKIEIQKRFIETSADNRQFISEEWINRESNKKYKLQFDCTQKSYKKFCLLKPNANIEIIPI